MVVEYEDEAELCFYTGFPPYLCFGDDVWLQVTPELRVLDNSAARNIPRAEWRRKYGNE